MIDPLDEIDFSERKIAVPARPRRPRLPRRLSLLQVMALIAMVAFWIAPLAWWNWDGPSRAYFSLCEKHSADARAIASPETLAEARKLLSERGRPNAGDLLEGVEVDASPGGLVKVSRLTGRPQEDADVANALVDAYLRSRPACNPWCGRLDMAAQPPKRMYYFTDTPSRLIWGLQLLVLLVTMLQSFARAETPRPSQRSSPPVAGAGDDPQR